MFCRSRFCTSMILLLACSAFCASRCFSATAAASDRSWSSCSSTSAGTTADACHATSSSSDTLLFSTLLSASSCSRTRTACSTAASCSGERRPAERREGACLSRKVRRLSRVARSALCCASSRTTSSTSSCAASATWNRLKLAVALTARSLVLIANPPCCALAVWSTYSFGTLRSEELLEIRYLVACSVCETTRTRSALASFPPSAPANSVSTPTTLWSAGGLEAATLTAPSSPYWSSWSSPGSMGVNWTCPTKRPSSKIDTSPGASTSSDSFRRWMHFATWRAFSLASKSSTRSAGSSLLAIRTMALARALTETGAGTW
mmetsp:Transcript_49455/g.117383  ORF Transcript_49455/g.117383 Transcript_49455/m.117383 type:complete len:320 (-) Transcript_49455:394-1353(-)